MDALVGLDIALDDKAIHALALSADLATEEAGESGVGSAIAGARLQLEPGVAEAECVLGAGDEARAARQGTEEGFTGDDAPVEEAVLRGRGGTHAGGILDDHVVEACFIFVGLDGEGDCGTLEGFADDPVEALELEELVELVGAGLVLLGGSMLDGCYNEIWLGLALP